MPASLRSLPPSKKRKIAEDTDLIKAVQTHEQAVLNALSSNSSLNPLADLVNIALRAKGVQETSKAIYALYRVFCTAILDGRLGSPSGENARTVKIWISERLNAFVEFLGCLLKDEDRSLRSSSLQILLSLLKHLSSSATETFKSTRDTKIHPQFHVLHFRKIIGFLLTCPASSRIGCSKSSSPFKLETDIRDYFVSEWLSVYDDIRWFFLRDAVHFMASDIVAQNIHVPANTLSILEKLATFPNAPSDLKSWWVCEFQTKPPASRQSFAIDEAECSSELEGDEDGGEDDWRKFFDDDKPAENSRKPARPPTRLHKMTVHQCLYSLNSHRAVFTRAWMSLLPLLSVDSIASRSLAVRVLNVMHRGILPHLTRPILVMDWVGACIDYGGTAGLLALNALFLLIKEYNLDYPSFYTRLYTFLDRDVLHVKHRARFFRLTELFLTSTHLPANLLASFVKRLSRLTLNASPSAIIMVIPFIYNILKRHPALMVMIHRVNGSEVQSTDTFNDLEPDPMHTHAIESSLWELYSHRSHYHSAVSTLAKVFEEVFTKPNYSIEDFLDHTYGTLLETDVNRKVKQEPPISIDLELQSKKIIELFSFAQLPDSDHTSLSNDVVSEFWTFGI